MERPRYFSPKEYQDAAGSPNTPEEELANLALSEYNFVRLAVAKNPQTTSAIFRLLLPQDFAGWNNQEIVAEIAKNCKAPHETLLQLAERLVPYLDNGRGNEMAVEAAVNLCNNTAIPLDIIRTILSDRVAVGVRRRLATRAMREDVLQELTSDPSEAVRRKASSNLGKKR